MGSEFFGPEEQKKLDKARLSSTYVAQPLSEAEQQAIINRKSALQALYGDGPVVGTYKIELNFGKGRSRMRPFQGSLLIWRSGSALSGGGDEIMYPCPNDRCPGVIPPELISSMLNQGGCPKCNRMWPRSELKEMRLFRLPAQFWSYVIARYWVRLNNDADVYLKTHFTDIRLNTLKEQMSDRGGSMLRAARTDRVPVIYPLANIYTDLSAGGDLVKRFTAFITA